MRNAQMWRRIVGSLAILAGIGALQAGSTAFAAIDIVPRIKPPAPGPVYVTVNDLERLKLIKKRSCAQTIRQGAHHSDHRFRPYRQEPCRVVLFLC